MPIPAATGPIAPARPPATRTFPGDLPDGPGVAGTPSPGTPRIAGGISDYGVGGT